MPEHVMIVGAGLIGASIGWQLQRQGAQVTFVEAGLPGAAASGRSFGWINAGYYLDEDHYHLRAEGIAAWHRLHAALPDLPLQWCGCLSWDLTGAELETQVAVVTRLGYPHERLTRAGIEAHVPGLSADVSEAMWFPNEGVAEAGTACLHLLTAAQSLGARLISGTSVLHLIENAGRITGVMTQSGALMADRVIIAAGTGAARLLEPLGVPLPMLTRPGAIMRSRPVPRVLQAVMVSPDLEFRQDETGRILAPSAASHQSDESEALDAAPDVLAADTLVRLRHWLPDVDLEWEEMKLAMRPVPGDGRPVVGPCGPDGLYVAVMHSGVTLGALIGEAVAQEVLSNQASAHLKPYRPQRFAADIQ